MGMNGDVRVGFRHSAAIKGLWKSLLVDVDLTMNNEKKNSIHDLGYVKCELEQCLKRIWTLQWRRLFSLSFRIHFHPRPKFLAKQL